ncbi:acyltransferase domain-containing protein [Micromonospora sp. NPDC048905]|uniref:acyltransferase domain-containing protein n=1 Tax=Micromonospora sp. NPDC048905 TaxID=3155494 RepID=UPI0033E90BC0
MFDQPEIAVGVFPGQGAYFPGCLDFIGADRELEKLVEQVDRVSAAMLGHHPIAGLRAGEPPSTQQLFADSPDTMQLAIFTTTVATHDALRRRGGAFGALIGHSMGEIAALVAGGALSVEQGASVLCHRIAVLREHATAEGGLVAVGCGRDRMDAVLALLDHAGPVIASDNGPEQVVVSGSADALRRVKAIAAAIGVPATPLLSAYPFHHTMLTTARQALAERLTGLRAAPMHTPVFSPILGRFYRADDDLAAMLSAHLVLPVDFAGTVGRLHRAGARVWVELGAGRALTNVVRSLHPDVTVLTPVTETATTIAEAAAFLVPSSTVAVPPAATVRATPVPPTATPTAPPAPPTATPTAPPAPPAPTPAAATPEVREAAGRSALPRSEIAAQLRAMYAQALEYPEEVFEDAAQLEADLGVDSVKQTELLNRIGQTFALGMRPEGMRIGEYRTFGNVVDLVHGNLASGQVR